MKITNKLLLATCLVAIASMESNAIFESGVEGTREWVDQSNGVAICNNIEGFINYMLAFGYAAPKTVTITDFAMDYLYKRNLHSEDGNRSIDVDGTFTETLGEYTNLEKLIITNVIDEYEDDNRATTGENTTKVAYTGNFYDLFKFAKKNLTVEIKNINLSKTNLTNVKGSFTSNNNTTVTIMPSGLESVTISGGHSWTEPNAATFSFSGSGSTLTSFSVNRLNASSGSSLAKMFKGCSNLRYVSVNIGESLSAAYMFQECTSPTLKLNTSALSLKSKENIFNGYTALQNLYLGSFDTTNTTYPFASGSTFYLNANCQNMFTDCGSTNGVNLHFNNLSGNVSYPPAFDADNSIFKPLQGKIKSFNVSGDLTLTGNILASMFKGCTNLTTVSLGKITASNATSMQSMFEGCSNLTAFYWNTTSGKTPLTGTLTSTANMFKGCSKLNAYYLRSLSYLSTDNVTDMSSMFENWGKNPSATASTNQSNMINYLKLLNTNNVTNMSSMFKNSGLTTLGFLQSGSSFDTSKVTNMSSMFEGTAIKLADINSSSNYGLKYLNTSKVENMSNMFKGCTSISGAVAFPSEFDTSSVTNMSGMFQNCSNMTSLDVSHFNTSAVTNMNNMFNGDSKLATITVSDDFAIDTTGDNTTTITGFLTNTNSNAADGNGDYQVSFETISQDENEQPLYNSAFKTRVKAQHASKPEAVFDEAEVAEEIENNTNVIAIFENGAVIANGEVRFLDSGVAQVAGKTTDIAAANLTDTDYTKDIRTQVGGTLTGTSTKQPTIYGPVTREHSGSDWIETETNSAIYYPSPLSGRGIVKYVTANGLRELYKAGYLHRLYRNVTRSDEGSALKLASAVTAYLTQATTNDIGSSALAAGELPLSSRVEYESDGNYVIPGSTFVIDCSGDSDIDDDGIGEDNPANIQANLSNTFESDGEKVPATDLQIISGDNELTISGNNSGFEGALTLGDSTSGSAKATVKMGVEGTANSSIQALGGTTTIDAYNGSKLFLLGANPIDVEHNWTFHGTSKIDSNARLTLKDGVTFSLGAQ